MQQEQQPSQSSLSQQRSTDDINLAYQTLLFIQDIPQSRRSNYDLASLVANLCDFQFRFSVPMPLPFGLGKDFPEKLATPRPFNLLKEVGVIVPVAEAPADPEKHDFVLDEQGKPYVFVGSSMWRKQQEQPDATHPLQLSAFRWIEPLMAMFVAESRHEEEEATKKKQQQRSDLCRRLAACWYYTATEANFDDDDDADADNEGEEEKGGGANEMELNSEEEEATGMHVANSLLQQMFGGGSKKKGQGQGVADLLSGYDEDADADFVPGASGSESMDHEMDDDEEEDDDEDYDNDEDGGNVKAMSESSPEGPSTFKVPGNPYRKKKQAEEDGEEDDEDDDDDDDEEEEDEEDEEVIAARQEVVRQIRSNILGHVESLHCYMPSPSTHMTWFKRMLVRMQPAKLEDEDVDAGWFPWGVPPVQQVLTTVVKIEGDGSKKLTPQEDAVSDYLREVLQPFMAMQQGQKQ